jgi:glycosyltransferase involved in cell wall biosynthesis
MPLSFCMITTFYPPYSFGGDAIYLYNLCDLLVRAGHQVDVIHCADSYHLYKSKPESCHYAVQPGVRVHRLESGLGALSPLLSHQTGYPVLQAKRIREVFASRRFDVIHYHNTSLFGPGALTLRPEYDGYIKAYTAHEHWLVCPMNVLWKYTGRACDEPECFRCTIASGRPPQLWRYTPLLDRSARSVDLFLSPSRFSAKMHHDRGFSFPIHHLPYFTTRKDQDWEAPGSPPHPRPYFLFAGRLEEIKGLQNALPEFAGEGGYDLVVVGSGTYEGKLREQARGMSRVKFTGWISQDKIGSYYAHALAVIVPSITYETFGLPTIEAFARKTPVVVNNLGPLPEIVEESGGGYVYSAPGELRGALETLAGDRRRRDELGQRGYQAFQRLWTPERHLEQYLGLVGEARQRRGFVAESCENLGKAVTVGRES